MGIFSKINSCILALSVVITTFGQVQPSSGDTPVSSPLQESQIPLYSGLSSQFIWGLIDFDSGSSLFNLYSNADSEEDSKNSLDAEIARESTLGRLSSLYLAIARAIDINPSIGEILYPFHFYF